MQINKRETLNYDLLVSSLNSNNQPDKLLQVMSH